MASEPSETPAPEAASSSLSFAERLQSKHAREHQAAVEEVPDEDDPNPPLSVSSSAVGGRPSEDAAAEKPTEERDKAKGKEKAEVDDDHDANDHEKETKSRKPQPLDTKSEELFPALGSGPKPRAAGAVPMAWGSKKPSSIANGLANGNKASSIPTTFSNPPTPGSSTPTSRPLTPSSPNIPIQPRGPGSRVTMPGRVVEKVSFVPSQLLPRSQLKKPVKDIVRDVNKRSRATVEMKLAGGGGIDFEATGPSAEIVQQALKDVAKEVGAKQSIKVPIPIGARAHVIGRQGSVINEIRNKSGAQIRLPKPEEINAPPDSDDTFMIDVTIDGDPIAVVVAQGEIEAIVNEKASKVTVHLRDVPPEMYPFLAGVRNTRIQALEAKNGVKIDVPRYYSWTKSSPLPVDSENENDIPQFSLHPHSHIQVHGDRQNVQKSRLNIDGAVDVLRKELSFSQFPINRGQHQFIIGNNCESLDELQEETGCSVILPPQHEASEIVTVVGPRKKLELGADKVMSLATSMQLQSVDIASQHRNAPMGGHKHARDLTRYLQKRRAIAHLENKYDSRIVLPTFGEDGNWEVYSRDGKNCLKARNEITTLVGAYPPPRFSQLEMDPFFNRRLQSKFIPRLQQVHGVHLLMPEIGQPPHLVLVYEGPGAANDSLSLPVAKLSQAELDESERALRNAEQELHKMVADIGPLGTQSVEVPPKFHEKVHRFVRTKEESIPEESLPVQTLLEFPVFGHPEDKPWLVPAEPDHLMYLRGPSDRLASLAEQIKKFVESEEQDEIERGFTLGFDFPPKFANFLIGRRGENINKLRDEFDVEIQVKDGRVELKGPQAKVEAAKVRILSMERKLADETTHKLKIAPQYHRELIGAKGSQVNRLQDRYKVRVQFPKSAGIGQDDASVDGSEVNGSKNAPKGADEVVIVGPKRGADEARDEILNLAKYLIDNSHNATVSVAQSQLPSLIGQGGREMESVRQTTGAKITVPGHKEDAEASSRVEIKIKGTKKQVEDAKKLLEERAKVFDDTTTKVVKVEKKYHRALIGAGGGNLRDIVVKAGGPSDPQELARIVRFPKQESDDTDIRVQAGKDLVEKIVAAIEHFVAQRRDETTETVEIPPDQHRHLIGPGGETRRMLEHELGVSIDIPKQTVQGPERSKVKLTGKADKIRAAKERILGLVKPQESDKVMVPRSLHHVVSERGSLFRQLRTQHRVTVTHDGEQPPPKPAPGSDNNTVTTTTNGGASSSSSLPLITDDQDDPDAFSWRVVDKAAGSTDDGEIPWVLRGAAKDVQVAKEVVVSALKQATENNAAGYLLLPDPRMHRKVIGSGGSQINFIRRETGCKINVPREQTKGAPIEIIGSRDGVEHAKELILEAVER